MQFDCNLPQTPYLEDYQKEHLNALLSGYIKSLEDISNIQPTNWPYMFKKYIDSLNRDPKIHKNIIEVLNYTAEQLTTKVQQSKQKLAKKDFISLLNIVINTVKQNIVNDNAYNVNSFSTEEQVTQPSAVSSKRFKM